MHALGIDAEHQPKTDQKAITPRGAGSQTPHEKVVTTLSMYHENRSHQLQSTFEKNCWFQVACVLKFDIEVGAVMEHCFPPAAQVMHPKEEKDLTSLAFPDSNSLQSSEGTLQYSFRLRHFSKLGLNAMSAGEHSFSFGYTLFSQKKDPTSKRGFTQRAVVLISDMHPQIEFFYQLVGILASKCLDGDSPQEVSSTLKAFYDTVT